MQKKQLIEEIESDIADILATKFEYLGTIQVPRRSDNQLTFERNVVKRGKILKSCVLYVDIRDSVNLTSQHNTQTMGRLYTAFAKAVLKAAKHHSGHIRNIIGDRVMIVFPTKDCFTNAVDCAISINHIAAKVINRLFKEINFKCGIGIDYGDLKVIKVGIQRRGDENAENRSLVWVGYPANIASRLTDVANKTIEETYFKVTRNPINPQGPLSYPHMLRLRSPFGYQRPVNNEPQYLTSVETVEMSQEEFANNISSVKDGELYMLKGKFIKFSKETRKYKYPEILMTNQVYEGFKKANPKRISIIRNLWKEQKNQIKNVSDKVYGGNVIWTLK